MRIYLRFIIPIIGSIILQILLAPLRGFYFIGFCSIVGFVSYFLFSAFLYSKFRSRLSANAITLLTILGILIVQLPLRISSFSSSLMTLPDMVCHILGIVTFACLNSFRGFLRITTFGCLMAFAIFMSSAGYDLWENKINNDTFSGEIFTSNPISFKGLSRSGNVINESTFASKWVLLDFWFIGCQPCYQGFPELERIYKKYEKDPRVIVSAVDLARKEELFNESFNFLDKKGYTFPNFVMNLKGSTNPFDIKACPTAIVLNSKGQIVFKGNLDKAELFLQHSLAADRY